MSEVQITKGLSSEELKKIVREKYGAIANSAGGSCSPDGVSASSGCCGVNPDDALDYSVMSEDYTKLGGYVPEADLKLGCGIPVEHARIKSGDKVLDLGSGAGNDVFVARQIVGETGEVVGLDMTKEMLKKARANKTKLGFENVKFVEGDIESIPLESDYFDVVISNCVLNLVPNKQKAFAEIFRVLKRGGHFCVSDIVVDGEMPDALRSVAELYAGCVSGAINREEYLGIARVEGFGDSVRILESKEIRIPQETFDAVLSDFPLGERQLNGAKIVSVTVFGEKK